MCCCLQLFLAFVVHYYQDPYKKTHSLANFSDDNDDDDGDDEDDDDYDDDDDDDDDDDVKDC